MVEKKPGDGDGSERRGDCRSDGSGPASAAGGETLRSNPEAPDEIRLEAADCDGSPMQAATERTQTLLELSAIASNGLQEIQEAWIAWFELTVDITVRTANYMRGCRVLHRPTEAEPEKGP